MDIILDYLLENKMYVSFVGGGATIKFNSGKDAIKFSEIANKYSLKKMEILLGECPVKNPQTNNIDDSALIAKINNNNLLLLTLAFQKYKDMILNNKPKDLVDVKPSDVPAASERMDHNQPKTLRLHLSNRCSQCEHAIWMLTDHYEGPVTVNDLFRVLNNLDFTHNRYRCYCEKLHEYHSFGWIENDKDERPFLVKSCSRFSQFEEDAPATTPQAHNSSQKPSKEAKEKERTLARPITK